MTRRISMVIAEEVYLELKLKAKTMDRSMSWIVNEGIKGFLTGKKVTQADLIIKELEQKEARNKALEQISLLTDDLTCYPIDPLEFKGKHRNDDGTLNREWRHATQRNSEMRPERERIIKEINALRKKHHLPGRPIRFSPYQKP